MVDPPMPSFHYLPLPHWVPLQQCYGQPELALCQHPLPFWVPLQQCYGQPELGLYQRPQYFLQHKQGHGQFQHNFRTDPPISWPHPPPRPADFRSWTYATSQPSSHSDRFKVLSYNILADYLAMNHRQKLYSHIPHHILNWEWRKRRLMIEFGLWTPDIMCLQEVDKFYDLQEELGLQGYTGLWKMRTGNAVDGCAIFWHPNRFQLLHEEQIEYRQFGFRDNVAQICVFKSISQRPAGNEPTASSTSSQPRGTHNVVICNIHVLFNPKRGDVKLAQVRVLLNRAHQISKMWDCAPVIICGDFNCTPKSTLYNFISQQKINFSGIPRNQISGQYSATLYPSKPSTFSHGDSNESVFARKLYDCQHQEPNNVNQVHLPIGSTEIYKSNMPSKGATDVQSGEVLDAFATETSSFDMVSEEHFSKSSTDTSTMSTEHENSILTVEDRYSYFPSVWTPEEVGIASGSSDRMTVEHSLKLRSSYTDVEDYGGTRDSSGEPQVTSYHRLFMGTVDYIWYTEGLQTVKVLDTIPRHVLEQTPGFPTKKWGSDHIALACEFAFTKD